MKYLIMFLIAFISVNAQIVTRDVGAVGATVTTETDTLIVPAGSYKFTFHYTSVGDTTQVSLHGDFSQPHRVMPNASITYENLSASSYPKVYIRRYGGAGTAAYDYKILAE